MLILSDSQYNMYSYIKCCELTKAMVLIIYDVGTDDS